MRKRVKVEEGDKDKAAGARGGMKVAIPSYLRSRFGDKGSAIGDAPPTPCPRGGEGAGSGEECSEGDYNEAVEKMVDERSRRNTATRRRNKETLSADNNILLFGQWYRKKHNIQGEEPAPTKVAASALRHSTMACISLLENLRERLWHVRVSCRFKLLRHCGVVHLRAWQPCISDLRAFVLDRNAYWGDEIALRVFADAFKIVVCVVLQVGSKGRGGRGPGAEAGEQRARALPCVSQKDQT